MVYIQRNTPPPNKVLSFSLMSFVGGLNNRSQQLEANQASDLINMRFADDTVMEKRKGSVEHDTLALTGEVKYIDEFKPYADVDQLIRSSETEVYAGATKVATVSGQIHGVNFNGYYYFTDGSKLRVYGKFPQADILPHLDVLGTPVNAYTVFTVVNPPSGFTPLGTGYTEGVTKWDYGTNTVWYEPCQAEIDDTYIGSNVLPENPKYIEERKGRLFVSGSNKDNDNVFISDVRNPHYFGVYLPMQLPPTSDKVVGIYKYDDSIIVGRSEDIYAIQGDTNNPNLGFNLFQLKKLNTHTGLANQDAIDVAHNYLFFLGNDGNAYSLSSTHVSEKTLVTQILSQNIELEKAPINLTKADIRTASSIFFNDEWYVTMKDKIMVYSYRHRAWTMYNELHARSFYDLNDTLIWGNKDGKTVKFGDDFFDLGVPFKAFWSSKNFDMDEATYYKRFNEFFIVAHTYRNYKSDVLVNFQIDFVDVKQAHQIKNQISIFGRANWGDRFINRNMVASLPFILGQRGRTLKVTFSNGYFKDGEVATYTDLEGYPSKFDGLLVYVIDESAYYLYQDFEWIKQTSDDLNQTMKVYQLNGDYEMRGKR